MPSKKSRFKGAKISSWRGKRKPSLKGSILAVATSRWHDRKRRQVKRSWLNFEIIVSSPYWFNWKLGIPGGPSLRNMASA